MNKSALYVKRLMKRLSSPALTRSSTSSMLMSSIEPPEKGFVSDSSVIFRRAAARRARDILRFRRIHQRDILQLTTRVAAVKDRVENLRHIIGGHLNQVLYLRRIETFEPAAACRRCARRCRQHPSRRQRSSGCCRRRSSGCRRRRSAGCRWRGSPGRRPTRGLHIGDH